MRRWTPFWSSLAASVAVTIALWYWVGPVIIGALVLPLLFWPRGSHRTCQACGYSTKHPAVRYCPHDGAPLDD